MSPTAGPFIKPLSWAQRRRVKGVRSGQDSIVSVVQLKRGEKDAAWSSYCKSVSETRGDNS